MITNKRLLVPSDFSPASEVAFAYALDMAAKYGSAMRLLHVIDEPRAAVAYPDGFFVEPSAARMKLVEDATSRLSLMADRCRAVGIEAAIEVVLGRPARVIVERAQSHGTDVIVMGTHGRSGVAHLVLGSVAERVVRTAPCPVLTMRDTARVADALASGGDQVAVPAT